LIIDQVDFVLERLAQMPVTGVQNAHVVDPLRVQEMPDGKRPNSGGNGKRTTFHRFPIARTLLRCLAPAEQDREGLSAESCWQEVIVSMRRCHRTTSPHLIQTLDSPNARGL
jgi:hypothetical protein